METVLFLPGTGVLQAFCPLEVPYYNCLQRSHITYHLCTLSLVLGKNGSRHCSFKKCLILLIHGTSSSTNNNLSLFYDTGKLIKKYVFKTTRLVILRSFKNKYIQFSSYSLIFFYPMTHLLLLVLIHIFLKIGAEKLFTTERGILTLEQLGMQVKIHRYLRHLLLFSALAPPGSHITACLADL